MVVLDHKSRPKSPKSEQGKQNIWDFLDEKDVATS